MTDQRLDDIAGWASGTLAAFQNAFYKEYRGLNDRLINAALVAALNAVAPLIRAPLERKYADACEECTALRMHGDEVTAQLSLAQSALRTARADAMEEAAKVAAIEFDGADSGIAKAIRSLAASEKQEIVHASDCATHNMPAMPNGPCDCGADKEEVL